jgi:hypothetical protein
LELEKEFERVRQEKKDLESLLKKQLLPNNSKPNSNEDTTASTEENIKDLLDLANEELDRKSKIITRVYIKYLLLFSWRTD